MWGKKFFSLIMLVLFCLSYVLPLCALEHTSLEPSAASREILDIADEISNMADRWDAHQNYLNQLTEDLEASMTDSEELRFTLDRMQETYAGLRSDYGTLQAKLKRWKTISLVLGVTSVISAGSAILVLILN